MKKKTDVEEFVRVKREQKKQKEVYIGHVHEIETRSEFATLAQTLHAKRAEGGLVVVVEDFSGVLLWLENNNEHLGSKEQGQRRGRDHAEHQQKQESKRTEEKKVL